MKLRFHMKGCYWSVCQTSNRAFPSATHERTGGNFNVSSFRSLSGTNQKREGCMGPVRIRHRSHDFGWQSSHSVDRAGWQAKMASIEIWIA